MASLKTQPKADKLTRAVLRYFGGKWQIAPWVISHLPAHRIYVEPFGGAASVLMRKPRSTIEVYNDLDEEIVGIFQQLQDPAQCSRLMRLLRRTPYARGAFEQAFEPTCDPLTRAQRAIVRAYMSFHHGSLFDLKKRTFADARHRGGNHCKAHEWASYPDIWCISADACKASSSSGAMHWRSSGYKTVLTRCSLSIHRTCPAHAQTLATAAS